MDSESRVEDKLTANIQEGYCNDSVSRPVSLDLETWFYLKMLWGPIFLLVREEIMLYNSFLWDNGEVYDVAASPDNYPDPQRFFFLHCFCSLYPSLMQYLSSPFVSRISDGQEFLINSESSCVKSSLT